MKKRIISTLLSLILTLCMLLSITSVSASSESYFTDVADDAWYSDAVNFLYYWEVMNGTGDNKFSPDATLTRDMVATILHRREGEPSMSGVDNPFSDVPEGTWYTDAVKWAYYNNIVTGYGDGRFGPTDAVTKEQLALLLYRTGVESGTMPSAFGEGRDFKDLAKVNDWAYEAVSALNGLGVFVNLQGDYFNPQAAATRAEVASILYRYIVIMTAANDGYSG